MAFMFYLKKESMEASNGFLESWLMILHLKINTKPGTQEYILKNILRSSLKRRCYYF